MPAPRRGGIAGLSFRSGFLLEGPPLIRRPDPSRLASLHNLLLVLIRGSGIGWHCHCHRFESYGVRGYLRVRENDCAPCLSNTDGNIISFQASTNTRPLAHAP